MSAVAATTLRIVAVTRKPHSASYEQRIRAYVPELARLGVDVTCRVLPKPQREQRRLIAELAGYDAVWWHRSLVLPWRAVALRRVARRLVIDFDDPLAYSSRDGGRRSLTRRIRFATLLRRCDAVLVGSDYLRTLAARYCSRVELMPMAVDVPPEPATRSGRPTAAPIELLWLGSAATQPYLELIRGPLETLGREGRDVRLRLVAHEPMDFDPLPVDFRRWSPQEQEAALRECDIGLCPMPDTIWTRGKCPYKTLQYMAAGMPWVGSPVGENVAFAGVGVEGRGVCVESDQRWRDALDELVDDPDRRAVMGRRGHGYVLANHERKSLAVRLAAFWREISAMRRVEAVTGFHTR